MESLTQAPFPDRHVIPLPHPHSVEPAVALARDWSVPRTISDVQSVQRIKGDVPLHVGTVKVTGVRSFKGTKDYSGNQRRLLNDGVLVPFDVHCKLQPIGAKPLTTSVSYRNTASRFRFARAPTVFDLKVR